MEVMCRVLTRGSVGRVGRRKTHLNPLEQLCDMLAAVLQRIGKLLKKEAREDVRALPQPRIGAHQPRLEVTLEVPVDKRVVEQQLLGAALSVGQPQPAKVAPEDIEHVARAPARARLVRVKGEHELVVGVLLERADPARAAFGLAGDICAPG